MQSHDQLSETLSQIPSNAIEDFDESVERERLNELLFSDNLIYQGVEFSIYLKLLALTHHMSQREHPDKPPEDQLNIARLNAFKLAITFGNKEDAIAYLNKYRNNNKTSKQLVHDACLFDVPREKCNIELWQNIIKKHPPNNPHDLVLDVFAFAPQIEQYVQRNEAQLLRKIDEEVTQAFTRKFTEDYYSRNKKVEKGKIKLIKDMEKKINYQFIVYLKQELGIKDKNPKREDKKRLKDRLENPTENDVHEKTAIRDKISAEMTMPEENENITEQTLEEYIQEQFTKNRGKIQGTIKSKQGQLLSDSTSLEKLAYFKSALMYKRAAENPAAAEYMFRFNRDEDAFNLYLSLQPYDDDTLIPNITIFGKDISPAYNKFYLKKLPSDDPRVPVLGAMTSCCQSLGDRNGEICIIEGITHSDQGFYVLCRMSSSTPNDKDRILAQCWAWRAKDGNLVFDSIESQIDFRNKNMNMIEDFFLHLSRQLLDVSETRQVFVGLGGHTPQTIYSLITPAPKSRSLIDFGYSDAKRQGILADARFQSILLQEYIKRHPDTALNSKTLSREGEEAKHKEKEKEKETDQSAGLMRFFEDDLTRLMLNKNDPLAWFDTSLFILEWCDLCAFNERPDLLSIIYPYLKDLHYSENFLQKRYNLTRNFIEFLVNPKDIKSQIEFFVDHHVNINIRLPPNLAEGRPRQYSVLHLLYHIEGWDLLKELVLGMNLASVSSKDHGIHTLYALMVNKDWEMARLLIEFGAAIDAPREANPLYFAIMQNNKEMVQFLIKHGADIHMKVYYEDEEIDMVTLAIRKRYMDIAKLLIDHGAEVGLISDIKKEKDVLKSSIEQDTLLTSGICAEESDHINKLSASQEKEQQDEDIKEKKRNLTVLRNMKLAAYFINEREDSNKRKQAMFFEILKYRMLPSITNFNVLLQLIRELKKKKYDFLRKNESLLKFNSDKIDPWSKLINLIQSRTFHLAKENWKNLSTNDQDIVRKILRERIAKSAFNPDYEIALENFEVKKNQYD